MFSACAPSPSKLSTISGQTMGTTYLVKISGGPADSTALRAEIEKVLESINGLMSTYRPDSEISQFNDSASTDWFRTSAETFTVITTARDISEKSAGAFDITVGPLVELWGFGPKLQPVRIPAAPDLAEARKRVGMHLLRLDPDHTMIRKEIGSLRLDLSAIAKGYAVDKVSELLSAAGLHHHLVEIGGEIVAKGAKANGEPWQIAMEKPEAKAREIGRVVAVKDMAIATSGSYRNYFEEEGIRYSHTIDPQTGRPITHHLVSVSVAAPSCMAADAWATALMVLGLEEGSRLAEKFGLAASFTEKSQNELHYRRTSQWNSFFP